MPSVTTPRLTRTSRSKATNTVGSYRGAMADLPFGIDFGGTGIKGAPVDLEQGEFAAERERIQTPSPSTPEAIAEIFVDLLARFPDSTGPVGVTVPGVVHHGVVHTAANIDEAWIGTDADRLFTEATGRDVHVVNDADAAGLAEVAVRRGEGPQRAGHRHHARHRHRLGAGLQRRPGAQLRARPPRDRRARRRVAGRQQRPRAGGPVDGALGRAADDVLPDAREAVLPRPDRGRRRGSASSPRSSCRCSTSDTEIVPATLLNKAGVVGAALYASEDQPG